MSSKYGEIIYYFKMTSIKKTDTYMPLLVG